MITLYKIDNKNKIREWSIEIDGPKYRTIYGERNGQLITTEWTGCAGKNIGRSNETSPKEQAELEVESIVKKQREKGYSESPKATKFNVMLAKSYDDFKDKIFYPVYSQPKLDGTRLYVNKNGLFSRNHKEYKSIPHIFEELSYIFDADPTAILDGEAYNHEFKRDFNKIISLVKKTKPTKEDLSESKKKIQFHIYDFADINMNFKERHQWLKDNINQSDSIKLLRTDISKNKSELDSYYEEYIDKGYEGQIIRTNDTYQTKRTHALLKRKEFQDCEFVISNIVEGEGNRSGMAGHMEFFNEDGKWFKSNIKGSWEFLKKCLDEKDQLIGKQATIKYFNRTPDNIPRFPYVVAIRDYE